MRNPLLMVTVLLLGACSSPRYGLHDPGFQAAAYRSDYGRTEGSSGNPVRYLDPCIFAESFCGTGPTVGADTSAASDPALFLPGARYWVLHINNEPAFTNKPVATRNPGIPGQVSRLVPLDAVGDDGVLPVPQTVEVIRGSLAGENFARAHLMVQHLGPGLSGDPNGARGLPFASLGADHERGNGGLLGALNDPDQPHVVSFVTRVWDYGEPEGGPVFRDGGLWFYFYAISEWGGRQRGMFLSLKHVGDFTDASTPEQPGVSFRWNWPLRESFFQPGVDWAFIDAEDLQTGAPEWRCGFTLPPLDQTGVDRRMRVDLQALFECASRRGLFQQPMPGSGQLPLLGMHWAVEMNGVGGFLWTSIHDMRITSQ